MKKIILIVILLITCFFFEQTTVFSESRVPNVEGEIVIIFEKGFKVSEIKDILRKYDIKIKHSIGPISCFIKVYDLKNDINIYVNKIKKSGLFYESIRVGERYEDGKVIYRTIIPDVKLGVSQKEVEDFCKNIENIEAETKYSDNLILVTGIVQRDKGREIVDKLNKIPNIGASLNYYLSSE